MKSVLLACAYFVGVVLLVPFLVWSRLPLPEYSSFTAPCQILALIPGFVGILLRRVWYRLTLRRCGKNLTVDWLAVIRTRQAEIGDRCTFGVGNWIGWVKTGNDVMTGDHVSITSGKGQHDFADISRPMRQQQGVKSQTTLGNDIWIGSGAIIMTDVADGTVVGAGSIVTRKFETFKVLAGNPARILRNRGDGA